MKVVHGVTHLVESLGLRHNQVSILVLGILFEERFDLPSAVKEERGAVVGLGLKILRLIGFNIVFVDDLGHLILQDLNRVFVIDVMEHGVAIHPELLDSLWRDLLHQILHVNCLVQVNVFAVNAVFPPRETLTLLVPFITFR